MPPSWEFVVSDMVYEVRVNASRRGAVIYPGTIVLAEIICRYLWDFASYINKRQSKEDNQFSLGKYVGESDGMTTTGV